MTDHERAILDNDPTFQAWLEERQQEAREAMDRAVTYWRIADKGREVLARWHAVRAERALPSASREVAS